MKMPVLLIVDDEKPTRDALRMGFQDDYEVYTAANLSQAVTLLREESPDLVLTDLRLGGESGMDVLKAAASLPHPPQSIMMTAYGSVDAAVEAMKQGAYDFVTKPLNLDAVELVLKRALHTRNLETANQELTTRIQADSGLQKLLGRSAAMEHVFSIIRQVAPSKTTVLIEGESGTGKELVAQAIHSLSGRPENKFVAVNCAALSPQLLESELFGHEKGAFTGAIGERKGYFGEADGGTIFLDEVGELPMPTQARLLRVLETGEFIKVGSSKVEKTNVRIVAATNVNLTQAIADGRFREDLYYRLNTVPIPVPALRERGEDVVLLFRKFASDFAEKYRMPAIQLTDDAKQVLLTYPWPGNVRQLKNITEQISIIETNREINASILKNYLPEQSNVQRLPALFGVKNESKSFESEREILYQVLFDMRQDVTELKKLVHEIMTERATMGNQGATPTAYYASAPAVVASVPAAGVPTIIHPSVKSAQEVDEDIQDTEEYVEESLSLDEVEKEMIRKALEKHHGKRKSAAKDLNISERTLYRKIKEYGLD